MIETLISQPKGKYRLTPKGRALLKTPPAAT